MDLTILTTLTTMNKNHTKTGVRNLITNTSQDAKRKSKNMVIIMNDCIFCKIAKGEIPCYKVYEDDKVLAFLDIAQDAFGHTVVIPKKHFANIFECDEETLSTCISAVKKISNHYVNHCGFEGVNISNNNGKAAGQTVHHIHFHIIPRKSGDGINIYNELAGDNTPLDKQLELLKLN